MPYRFSKDEMREHWSPDNPRASNLSPQQWADMGVHTITPEEHQADRVQRRLQQSKARTPGTEEFDDRVAAKRGRYFVRRQSAKANRMTPGLAEWISQSWAEHAEHKAANPTVDVDHHHRRQWLSDNPKFDAHDYEDHMWLQNNPGVHPIVREQQKARGTKREINIDLREGHNGPSMY